MSVVFNRGTTEPNVEYLSGMMLATDSEFQA